MNRSLHSTVLALLVRASDAWSVGDFEAAEVWCTHAWATAALDRQFIDTDEWR